MSIPKIGGLTADQAEALFDLANNGVLTRIDERGQRAGELFQWGMHPHTAEPGSALAADDAAFAEAYPLILAGPQAVTEHALFPAMSAAESLHTVGILVARRKSHRQPHITEILQLCRVAMERAALTIWLLGDPDRTVRRDHCLDEEMEQLVQRRRYLVVGEQEETARPSRYPPHSRAQSRSAGVIPAHGYARASVVKNACSSCEELNVATCTLVAVPRSGAPNAHYPASPRKTSSARSVLITSESDNRPIWWVKLVRGTVVTLSIINELALARPVAVVGSIRIRRSGASTSLVVNGTTVTDVVASKRSS